ncbi:MAG: prolyl oligopeptidase family serine peptidase [Ardenticatenales bacterium]|nr:prolyl oligopeptidase family serine peptidase [Ardenticatenales bacterium]
MEAQPIPGVWVLLSRWDGTTYVAQSNEQGKYTIQGIPAGSYQPVAGAPGYGDERPGGLWGRVLVDPEVDTVVDIELLPKAPVEVAPGINLSLGDPTLLSCKEPMESQAVRRTITFATGDRYNQPAFLYTPGESVTDTVESPLPILLTVYPGPADTWECASIPLADAGYAVLAVGPAYSLELERDIDELGQILHFARKGDFPGADGERVAVLGGSYSAILVQRLLQRDSKIDASVLLGAPTDLFDLRRRFEQGSFIPPFGLDQVLIALGFPDREPLRYWTYSSVYHVSATLPPTILFHSYQDDIVPYEQSELLAEKLKAIGVEHELHLFNGATHYLLSGDKETKEIYRLTLDFLARHLRESQSDP